MNERASGHRGTATGFCVIAFVVVIVMGVRTSYVRKYVDALDTRGRVIHVIDV